ncbi:trans-sulfuration enzyme family protein [Acidipropionibacterium virtanenii]|nr:PLP-dependent transferase [Acidipropionibacterium virtanenii]
MRGLTTGMNVDNQHNAVVPPIYLSTNYGFEGLDGRPPIDYSRGGNPTRDQLGRALATLEGGAGGTITSSGMSAIALLIDAVVPVGGHVIAPHDCYGGTWRLLDTWAGTGRLTVDWVDETDLPSLQTALTAFEGQEVRTSLVWIETPSNPLLRITDIAAVSRLAHARGAVVAADNTFCSPLLQRPLEFGADHVISSDTKFINGHSDVVGGSVVSATAESAEQIRYLANVIGVTASPFDSWLTLRGLRTLDARLRVHAENTERIVELLTSHPAVNAVHWPGLPDHPGRRLARKQQDGPGSLLSFELDGGIDAVRRFLDGLRGFTLAESLGGVESLVCHPFTMTHAAMSERAKADAGVTESMVRMSVGIEPAGDLLACLHEALERV